MNDALDLFAGAGGWDAGLAMLGVPSPLGIEIDPDACATAGAAGHERLLADVAALDPAEVAPGPVRLLIASPPCQAWSKAGKRGGIADQPRIWDHLTTIRTAGRWVDYPRTGWHDDRSPLVLELVRWVDALRPEMVAAEQVPDVLPFWGEVCRWLHTLGYSATCGLLSAEQYGVPQTRQRAFLVARRDGRPARLPTPTHARYVAPRGSNAQDDGLFDPPDRVRIVLPADRHLLPWVSMAEALGWGLTHQPATTVVSGINRSTSEMPNGASRAEIEEMIRSGDFQPAGNAAERPARTIAGQRSPRWAYGEGENSYGTGWTLHTGSGYEGREMTREGGQPAPTLTGEARSGWYVRTEQKRGSDRDWIERDGDAPAPTLTTSMDGWTLRQGDRSNATVRPVDEPAPTVICSRSGNLTWALRNGNQDNACTRTVDEPAGTLFFGGRANAVDWIAERPATTVQGDPRLAGSGHRDREGGQRQFDGEAIRITVEQAGVLQGFPADYPWQGTRTARFRQVGDAVPPPLAAAVLGELIGVRLAVAS